MTTSGVYTFSVSRDTIIRDAMLNIGKLGEGEVPTASEVQDCALKLNMIVKQWQGTTDGSPGIKTWTRRRGHLFLSSTSGKYTLGPNATGWTENYVSTTTTANAGGSPVVVVASASGISVGSRFGLHLDSEVLFWSTVLTAVGTTITLAASVPTSSASGSMVFAYATTAQQPIVIETALLRDSRNEDVPLRIIRDVRDYDMLPAKTDPLFVSDPTSIYPEFQLGNSNLFTDVAGAQDTTKHIVLTYLEAMQDFVNPLDTPEYPQEYFLALSWALAKQIAPMFNMPWTSDMKSNYEEAVAIAKRKEPEISSFYFQCGETP